MLRKNKLHIVSFILISLCCACSDGEQRGHESITKMPMVTSSLLEEKNVTKEPEATKSVYSEDPELTDKVIQEEITPTAYPTETLSPTLVIQEQSTLAYRVIRKSAIVDDGGYHFLYPIKHDGKYGVINQYGEVIVDAKYERIFPYKDGMARVKVNGKYGFINSSGEMVIPADYKYAEDFSEGLAAVKSDLVMDILIKKGS